MDRQWHLIIGIIVFYLYQSFLDGTNTAIRYPWLIGIFLTAAGSVVPDILEPAYSSRHRGIFHSRSAMRLVFAMVILSALITAFSHDFPHGTGMYSASCFLLGYVFHLLADSTTPMGLPR